MCYTPPIATHDQKNSANEGRAKGAAGNCLRTSNVRLRREGIQNVEQLSKLDLVTTNANSSQSVQLYIFEDSGAVIKVKGRSPMMRHVSRTHRVASDWLFHRINLDPKIQIKYVDTKNQLAVMLTTGSFARDEWCNLLRLFNVMILSVLSRSHCRSVEKGTTMSKRIQDMNTEEELAVAKPRSVCLISANLNREQSSSFDPNASDVLVNPQLDSGSVQRSCGKLQRNRNPNPATWSQVWKKDKLSQGSCRKLQRGNVSVKFNKKRLGWTTIICKSHGISALRKS